LTVRGTGAYGRSSDKQRRDAVASASQPPVRKLGVPPSVAARLAALFFVASGSLTLITLPLPAPPAFDRAGTAAVALVALVAGILAFLLPWDRWHPRLTLIAIPIAFALISLGNLYGGVDSLSYGIFFVVAFVWIGTTQPQGTSAIASPLALIAYVAPLSRLTSDVGAGIVSAVVTIPVCVLVGESLAWSVSRRIRTAETLVQERAAAERLRTAKAMQETWISAASHELRTPIAICRGHLDVLAPDADAEEIRGTLTVVADEVDRMARLVEDVTTLSRLEDRTFIDVRELDLPDFLDKVAKKGDAPLRGQTTVDAVPPGATVAADPVRLAQALLNLLQNAATHGEGPVELRTYRRDGMWRFDVTDHGPGLSSDVEPTVFEPFPLGDRGARGSGLGLPIVRGIARAHRGSVGAENQPGRGVTMWIEIPA
jgi:signal transduction histidine kinase